MKKFVLAAALAGAATTGFAGSLDAPVMEPEVIVEESSGSSSDGVIFALLALAILGAAVAN